MDAAGQASLKLVVLICKSYYLLQQFSSDGGPFQHSPAHLKVQPDADEARLLAHF